MAAVAAESVSRAARAATLLSHVQALIPKLSQQSHKGQHGRIAVLGGCLEYCGAPFYAASAALKCGADIVHIVCSDEAAVPIKSFSPELIVHPHLRTSGGAKVSEDSVATVVARVTPLLPRIHALVVGPGLGRDSLMLECAARIVQAACEVELPVVLDADALFMLASRPELVQDQPWVVLTPNIVEFWRLYEAVGMAVPGDSKATAVAVAQLAKKLGVTVFLKGAVDMFAYSDAVESVSDTICTRRCGGQGDIVAGTTGVFTAWARQATSTASGGAGAGAAGAGDCAGTAVPAQVLACVGASTLTRYSTSLAFRKHRRGMTTPDALAEVPAAFEAAFPGATPHVEDVAWLPASL